MNDNPAVWAAIDALAEYDGLHYVVRRDLAERAVEAARPIIEAETLRKAADVISADEFTADDTNCYDPDYYCGIIEAASYLRRTADSGVDR